MRHDIERYRMLLRTESNPHARRVLMDMIVELESRPIVSRIRVSVAKDGPPVVRRRVGTATPLAPRPADAPVAEAKLD